MITFSKSDPSNNLRSLAYLFIAFLTVPMTINTSTASDVINPPKIDGPFSEFHLARLYYQPTAEHYWHPPGRPWWRIDWPEAEKHLTSGLSRYTRLDSANDSAHISLMDNAIFDYPYLFAQQVGRWQLSEEEITRLAEYLKRGGFMLADDIHGPQQWQRVQEVFSRALPMYRIETISPDSAQLAIVFPIDELTQIPGRRHVVGLRDDGSAVVRMPHTPQQWLGIKDENGRLIVAFNLNMDMGDAWEHADDATYPNAMTALAYKVGINYIIYSMTH